MIPSVAFGANGQPVTHSKVCQCTCHPATLPKPRAVEARLCQECADERFKAWEVLLRDD